MIEHKKRENENMGKLKSQMKDMSSDFEDMKNARIESKRLLELRFTNVYTEISENKEQTIQAMNNVHATLNAFQEEFQNRLQDLSDDLNRQLTEEGDIFRETWKGNHERMDHFEKLIDQERVDRTKYHDDHLNPVRAQLKGIKDGLVKEKKTRITNEKQIVSDIDNECNKMHQEIDDERKSRKKRLGDLDDMLTQDTDLTNKFLNNFEDNATNSADTFLDHLENELSNRLGHQDKVLGNMSQFVSRFQQTLKIFGKDV